MRHLASFMAIAGSLACSDYELQSMNPPVDADPSDPIAPPVTTPTEPTATVPQSTVPSTEPCSTFDANWAWWGSPPFTEPADWQDPSGVPFHDPAHQLIDYSTVQLPGRNIPPEHDKAYVAWFDLAGTYPEVLLDLQSDDGLWIWINGEFIGHWGGDWQEEGCVNEDASCLERVQVDPIDITDVLEPGANVIAARVSNAIAGSWFEVEAHCVEP